MHWARVGFLCFALAPAVACLATPGEAIALEKKIAAGPQARPPQTDAQQYCVNIAASAMEARFKWQAKRLSDLEAQIKQRIAELEAKQAEYKDWLARRQEAMKRAEEGLVGIYSHMRPEAAALQLSALDDDTAAAVLSKLSARSASAILNEMDPRRAARVANALAGNSQPPPEGKKS
jgi:flagellar motility protein MotE (MotC chaperone)